MDKSIEMRLFDFKLAKQGDPIVWGSEDCHFLGKSRNKNNEYFIIERAGGLSYVSPEELRMKPLCVVEGRGVYPGDILYWSKETGHPGREFRALSHMIANDRIIAGVTTDEVGNKMGEDGRSGMPSHSLTWEKPKRKRKIELFAFYNKTSGVLFLSDLENQDKHCIRVPLEDRVIEVEDDE